MNIEYEKTLSFTGHRPTRLFGYDYQTEGNRKMLMELRTVVERFIASKGYTTFITGMALGIDIWAARIVLALKSKHPQIKLICAVPCMNQYKKWTEEDKEIYRYIIGKADYVYYVSEEEYIPWCMQKRNEWMVDNSSYVIAVWDGESGGTSNCINYAKKRQRPVLNIHPRTLDIQFIKK